MAEPIFIDDLISKIISGNIRIPSFQRGFVWDAERVAHLMDSIYKGFPFGSLLFWRTKTPLSTERDLGPFSLPKRDPDYPIDYVLDGQQRATSIFGVFQTVLAPGQGKDASQFEIYYDLTQTSSIQDSNFIFVPKNEFDPDKHFPLKILFNPPEYRQFLKRMKDEIATKVDELYKRFTTAKIPVQTFETNDRTAVAIVFERINRMGMELDTLQLLCAWTWNEDFDLKESFSDLAEELEPFGFKDVGEDSDLLLRCCSAILQNDASPSSIINLDGREVRERFLEIQNGIKGSVDFLKTNFKISTTKLLPYPQVIIPLSVFFATPNEQDCIPNSDQKRKLEKWIWKTFFSRRYSKRLDQLNEDIREIHKLKNRDPNRLGDFECIIDEDFFMNQFSLNTANSKTFVLMLGNSGPLNFISGSPVSMEQVLRSVNRKEFHHVFPNKFLKEKGISAQKINCLANFAVISRGDNNKLGGAAPSIYRAKMPSNEESLRLILKSAVCPENIFHDDFEKFLAQRTEILRAKAVSLIS